MSRNQAQLGSEQWLRRNMNTIESDGNPPGLEVTGTSSEGG